MVHVDALLSVSFDSQVKWASRIGQALAQHGVRCHYVVPAEKRHSLSPDQLEELAGVSVSYLNDDELLHAALDSDIVVWANHGMVGNAYLERLVTLADDEDKPLPVSVGGWVGVIIEHNVAGFLMRASVDVLGVNSRSDFAHFTSVARELGLSEESLLLSGLALLPGVPEPQATGPIRRVLFADQPTIPRSLSERYYLYTRLADYARAHPDREVVLKPRHRPGEDTYHRMATHPADILADIEHPANLVIDYSPISEQLATTDLMLTLSSTAALEAIAAGVRTAFVADLGVAEVVGNHVFVGSGLLRTMAQLTDDDIGTPDARWLADFFPGGGTDPSAHIAMRAIQLTGVPAAERPSALFRSSGYAAGRRAAADWLENHQHIHTRHHVRGPKAQAPLRTVTFRDSPRGRLLVLATAVLPASALAWLKRVF